jgi:SAM-dependent methyltransferase
MAVVTRYLDAEEILKAAGEIEKLYPRAIPIVLWRAWEVAAYRACTLKEPVLDLACGDGRFFRFLWPLATDVIGIDSDETACTNARAAGVYKEVHHVPAHQLPFEANQFASIFSNCALEHMDHIDGALGESNCVLKPGGLFVSSVVTDKFVEWGMLPLLSKLFQAADRGEKQWKNYENYHHLRNPFTLQEWIARIERAGFRILQQAPILPEPIGRLFMLFDEAWHVDLGQGRELGLVLHQYLAQLHNYEAGMQDIMRGLMRLTYQPLIGAGAVFVAQKTGTV